MEAIPPPKMLVFARIASTRGSYKNSHVGCVVCSFTTTIASPPAALPTPTNGAPPPVKLVADWLPIPLDPVAPTAPPIPEPGELPIPPVPGLELPKLDPEAPPKDDPEDPSPELPDPELDPEPDPKLDPELDPKLDPVLDPKLDPELAPEAPGVPPIPELIPDALPSPELAIPASGWPKNPFTVVFASPTWISRQSAFPVSGSTYFRRRYRWLFVFSSCSIDPGYCPPFFMLYRRIACTYWFARCIDSSSLPRCSDFAIRGAAAPSTSRMMKMATISPSSMKPSSPPSLIHCLFDRIEPL